MVIENCLILCAGLGTRMGKIGEVLPKPLSPIGEYTFLSYQYYLAKSIGIKNIHINVSHLASSVVDYIEKSKLSVNIHFETSPLEVGGAIQSLVNKGYDGNFLMINNDQIIKNGNTLLKKLIKAHSNNCIATLGVVGVEIEETYNRLIIENSRLVKVCKYNECLQHAEPDICGFGNREFKQDKKAKFYKRKKIYSNY